MDLKKQIANNLKFLRERERKGRTRMSKLLGVSVQKIDRIERGDGINIEIVKVYSDYFDIPMDRIVKENLSETYGVSKPESTISETDITISEADTTISKPDKPILKTDKTISEPDKNVSEDEKKAFECAKQVKFNCYFYKNKAPKYSYCKYCIDTFFWGKEEIAREVYNTRADDVEIIEGDWLDCEHFQLNPLPNCYFRNIQKVSSPKCQRCLRDVRRWGELAVGFKDLKKNENKR